MSLTLNLSIGSIRIQCDRTLAADLKAALDRLMQSLKAVAAQPATGSKPTPEKSFEYQHRDRIFLEIFCNPNLYPSPYAAKVLLTLQDEQLRVVVETELTQMLDDVTQFLESAQ